MVSGDDTVGGHQRQCGRPWVTGSVLTSTWSWWAAAASSNNGFSEMSKLSSASERRGAMVLAIDGSNKYRLLPDVTFDTALSRISFRAGVPNDPHRPEEVW